MRAPETGWRSPATSGSPTGSSRRSPSSPRRTPTRRSGTTPPSRTRSSPAASPPCAESDRSELGVVLGRVDPGLDDQRAGERRQLLQGLLELMGIGDAHPVAV